MSPEFMRGMSYFLPTISLIFTSFLPSAIQLSFFITGFLSYCQAQLFRWAPFRTYMNMTPLPTRRPDAFARAPAAEPSPYQSRIITATARPSPSVSSASYEPPRSASTSAKPTLLSGLKHEVSSGISSVQESARKTLKSAREIAGQEAKDGKRTKRQLQQANEYEKKRRLEEGRRREELDAERRARREGKRVGR
jgi:YidC/Oxa1 family membrane protein insertase